MNSCLNHQNPPNFHQEGRISELNKPDNLNMEKQADSEGKKMGRLNICKMRSQKSRLLNGDGSIKPKMFSKLGNWMDKICSQVLNFSSETLQIALQILINYLQIQHVQPSEFQLIGCVCLHLASKINEKTIIAIQSYIECCLRIFDKQSFVEAEVKIYHALDHTIVSSRTLHQIFYFLCASKYSHQLNQQQDQRICCLLKEVMKNLEFTRHSHIEICQTIFRMGISNQQQQLSASKLLQILNNKEQEQLNK